MTVPKVMATRKCEHCHAPRGSLYLYRTAAGRVCRPCCRQVPLFYGPERLGRS
jgi:hypothetical protein